jgi:hypothetical protein
MIRNLIELREKNYENKNAVLKFSKLILKTSTITSQDFTFESRTHISLLHWYEALRFTVIRIGLSVYRVLKHLLILIGQIDFFPSLSGSWVVQGCSKLFDCFSLLLLCCHLGFI